MEDIRLTKEEGEQLTRETQDWGSKISSEKTAIRNRLIQQFLDDRQEEVNKWSWNGMKMVSNGATI